MITVLWPTIRPKVAIEAALQWSALTHRVDNVCFSFGVQSVEHADIIANSLTPQSPFINFHCCIEKTARPGVTDTATRLTRCHSDFIIVLASDDFEVQQGWDKHLIEQFDNFNGALICKDGYRPKTNIVPLPIVHRDFLKRLNGVIYSPFYNHFFSDQEFFDIVMEIGSVKDLRGTDSPLFVHKHWSFGGRKKDDFDLRNNGWWDSDKKMYESRKSLSLEEKLKLPEWWV